MGLFCFGFILLALFTDFNVTSNVNEAATTEEPTKKKESLIIIIVVIVFVAILLIVVARVVFTCYKNGCVAYSECLMY